MARALLIALGTIVVIAATPVVVILVSLRTGWPPGVRFVRRLGRDHLNAAAMRTAGAPGAAAQVIRTVGRRSGRPYRTPIGLRRTPTGWIVTLPYGTTPDWLRNLLAAGSAEVEVDGEVRPVTAPRVVSRAAAADLLGSGDRLISRLLDIDHFLLLDDAPSAAA
ncbi:nitroreductase family deazaflavin-dependent oxidoreductase [Microbacterium karelineae]|uniref:nitroreductase family deazaflavin-dependent oxidoreductase n=1 Tax=Microbacterium karelineae TaxID=2654283 RepID=UPI0012EA0046|nr:nitroreductase family deazaflavin-dependent oxidoreductase [Microbacterium karelineae]